MAEALCLETSGLDFELGPPEDKEGEGEEEVEERKEDNNDDNEEEISVTSSTSSFHRIQSDTTLSPHCQEDEEDEVYRRLARSNSDALLLTRHTQSMEAQEDFPQNLAEDDGSHNVSECSRVYLDLSRAEPFERVQFTSESTVTAMFRTSSGRQLETIPQDEELKTVDLSQLYASQRSLANSLHSSLEEVSLAAHGGRSSKKIDSSSSSSSSSPGSSASSSQEALLKSSNGGSSDGSLQSSLQTYTQTLKQQVKALQMGSIPEQAHALQELSSLLGQAWGTPVHGRDLACSLGDLLRTERALDLAVTCLTSQNRPLLLAAASLLSQALTTPNRNYLAHCAGMLDTVVRMARDHQGDVELAEYSTGILESLFKTSERSCGRVIALGGLKVIVHWCRSHRPAVLRNCACALANLALYGGADNQQEMIDHKAPEWLFPLAFVEDDVTRYYACLTMGALLSNRELQHSVLASGTLDLVMPFLRDTDPLQFALRDPAHVQGRSADWLRRLAPVLRSSREEARALAAFTLVMEAGIKTEQGKKEVLYEVGAVDHLRWLARNPKSLACTLAGQALAVLGEEVPVRLSLQVPLWTLDNVQQWLTQVGFGAYCEVFGSCYVDGDLLLRLTETELRDTIGMSCALTQKRFMRELNALKMAADYVSCDPTKLSHWLKDVGSEFTLYAYPMLQVGVDKPMLTSLTENLLANECEIHNGIHRMKILSKIEDQKAKGSRPSRNQSSDSVSACGCDVTGRCRGRQQPIDVFLSYRRSNGSQLASLLKVHLQLRGFSVFIDIERLMTGKFDEQLLESVRQTSHLVVVLTERALDRCVGDHARQDWVHKEIAEAMEAGVNIIPVMADGFVWPSPDSLPKDISNLHAFNGVRWIHDYQDACVDKLESFLRGEHPHSSSSTTTPNTPNTPAPLHPSSSSPHHTLPPPPTSSSSSSSPTSTSVGDGGSRDKSNNDAAADDGKDDDEGVDDNGDANNGVDNNDDVRNDVDDDDNNILRGGSGRGGSTSSTTLLLPPPVHAPPSAACTGSSVDGGCGDGLEMNGVLRCSDHVVNGSSTESQLAS